MPYITKQARRELCERAPQTVGELNYLLTISIKQYLKLKGLSYATCNDIVGALDSCKVEFQRRVVAPYEDTKIAENGDVY